jgi:hypothetical protein
MKCTNHWIWVVAVVVGLAAVSAAHAVSFTTSYTTGGTWRTIYAQGFKASVSPTPDPMHAITDTVLLDRFQFFKSGQADTASNIQLAIVNNYFLNLATFTTSSPELVGLSTNTIGSTASLTTGDPITFEFNHLPLVYGADTQDEIGNNNYTAIFVNNNGGTLTPVLVSALSVNYLPGQNEIATDYGSPGNYFLSTSNFINTNEFGSFFATFLATDSSRYGDSNFVATFDLPAVLGDYNGNGTVDVADYVVWRNNPASLMNEGATPNVVDEQDYIFWRSHFGDGSGAGTGVGATSGVPESPAFILLALGGSCLSLGRRRRPAKKMI